jgi:hypothetical protein
MVYGELNIRRAIPALNQTTTYIRGFVTSGQTLIKLVMQRLENKPHFEKNKNKNKTN